MLSLRWTKLSDLAGLFQAHLRLTLGAVFTASVRWAARLFLGVGSVFFSFPGGVCDHRRHLLCVRFVHGVAGALDFRGVALGPRIVTTLEVGVDDLVAPGDNSPARLGLPGGCRQRSAENLRRGQYLGEGHELRPLA